LQVKKGRWTLAQQKERKKKSRAQLEPRSPRTNFAAVSDQKAKKW